MPIASHKGEGKRTNSRMGRILPLDSSRLSPTTAVPSWRNRATSELRCAGRSEAYTLTPDGLDYLAGVTTHLKHATFKLKGNTLNALVTARESSFERDRTTSPTVPERPIPSQTELAEAVLAEFQELRRERHGHSGLVPIHEVRQRIADRFGPAAGRHDVLDEVIRGLWRQQRLALEAISDLGDATEQQLNDSIPGISGTLFYLEAPREQPVASESL